jgi:predicted phosphodiesterase
MTETRAQEMVTDLLRSAWIVERSRAEVYSLWHRSGSAERAEERAGIVARTLEGRARDPDGALVPAHTRWMLDLAGESIAEEPFGDIFLARLGDWVEAHASPFLDANGDSLMELGDAERAELTWPENIPEAPPYEPVEAPDLRPPGRTRLRFGILGDTHFGSELGAETATAAIADLNASGAELVVQLGDLTDHGDRDEFELAAQVLSQLDVPLVTMMGNHDVYSYKEDRLSGRELYPEAFGRQPEGLVLEHKGFRFAVLDSVEHEASPFAPFDLLTGSFKKGPGGAVVNGTLTAAQHEILAAVAEPGADPTFIFLHHPVQPFTGFPPVVFGLRDEDSARLHATCDSGNVWGVFAGHTHRNARTRDFDDIPAHEVAIARDYPFGYALVDVSDDGYAYRFVQLSDEDLLRRAYTGAGRIHRRYALGSEDERAFVWARRQVL